MTHSSTVLFSFLLSETLEALKLYNLSKGTSVTLEIRHPLSLSAPSTREHRCPSVGFLAPWLGHCDGLNEKCFP